MITQHANIKIGDNVYKASFCFGVIKGMQNAIKGLKVDDIFKGVQEENFDIIIELLYHSIKFNHKTFTRKEIESLGMSDIDATFTGIAELFELSLPTPKEEDNEEKN